MAIRVLSFHLLGSGRTNDLVLLSADHAASSFIGMYVSSGVLNLLIELLHERGIPTLR